MKIDCVSDLHGERPKLPGGDLLLVAGDLLPAHDAKGDVMYLAWLERQKYKKIVFVGGNHDNTLVDMQYQSSEKMVYLCDSGTEFEGMKIWGNPWTKWFHGINPICTAFVLKMETMLKEKWEMIPLDTNILVTHMPPFGMMDQAMDGSYRCGSKTLGDRLRQLKDLKLHVFGHIHEGYGQCHQWCETETPDGPVVRKGGHLSVNAAHLNRDYEAVNPVIELDSELI